MATNEPPVATVRVPLDVEMIHGEIIEAARAFVATTSVFRQNRVCRPSFERLAIALLDLSRVVAGADRG